MEEIPLMVLVRTSLQRRSNSKAWDLAGLSAVTEAAPYAKIDSLMVVGLLLEWLASIRWFNRRIDLWFKEPGVQLQFIQTSETLKAAWSWLIQANFRRSNKHLPATLTTCGKSFRTKVKSVKVLLSAGNQFASKKRPKETSKKLQALPSTSETSSQIYSHAVVAVQKTLTTAFETVWTRRYTPICSSIAS